jgi:hypothetical protein
MDSTAANKIFGDPCDFAIEVGIEPGLTPPSTVWGHSCVWCRGVPLGDIDDHHCGLFSTFAGFEWLSEHLDELWDKKLIGLNDDGVWNLLDGLLYGYHGDVEIEDERSLEQVGADATHYGKFNFLTNWGEQFDGYNSFIICQPEGETVRILSRRFPAPLGLGVDVSKAIVLTASREFVHWYKEQERRFSIAPCPHLPSS